MATEIEQELEQEVEQVDVGRQRNVGMFFFGMLLGTIVGGVVALLFAPKSGRETRSMLRDRTVETRDKIQDRVNRMRTAMRPKSE